jgi:UDP-glucose 4-epimerase
MNILVTGGAGYIGSATVEHLVAKGHRVHVIDNLVTGHGAAVHPDATFHRLDIRQTPLLIEYLQANAIDSVVHFAAVSLVGESVTNPAKYMDNNVVGTLSLLEAMRVAKVNHIVFSSTAATYGEPTYMPLDEAHPTKPTNPYGLTKLIIEQTMATYAAAYGLRFVALRYFNACGATAERGEHHDPETHLIPVILQVALGQRPHISVYGTDYDTPDGSCVRDYIHVIDLGDAHLRALTYLKDGGDSLVCNLGNGSGYSVRQVIDTCRSVSGRPIPVVEGPRRAGDPSRLIANAGLAKARLGWVPTYGELDRIIADAWRWHSANPKGYLGR